jgi:hypothetical protein
MALVTDSAVVEQTRLPEENLKLGRQIPERKRIDMPIVFSINVGWLEKTSCVSFDLVRGNAGDGILGIL